VGRYLAAFGPASRDDVVRFTAIHKTRLKPILERMKLRRFLDEAGKEVIDVPRGLLPDPETPAPVRFLPTWDAALLVHTRRTGVLPERHRERIFGTKTPQSFPTFLVDGRVAGTWRHEAGRVRLDPFERIPRAVRRELDDEAERLAAFHHD
jgi:winged helix DNA-binding protein